jgi:long-chain acyl-CoA synthetase
VNSALNKWEKIVKYKILTNDISIETGELTPSMKISRSKIEEKYANIINSMY